MQVSVYAFLTYLLLEMVANSAHCSAIKLKCVMVIVNRMLKFFGKIQP
jgi:hypothetical protein